MDHVVHGAGFGCHGDGHFRRGHEHELDGDVVPFQHIDLVLAVCHGAQKSFGMLIDNRNVQHIWSSGQFAA